MAEVYLAAHRGFGDFERRVALKKILPVYSGMEEFAGLFQDEARISAALDHSGIVQVHDFGQHEGEFYIAMEYVDGPDLEEVLDRCRRRGILPPIEAVLHIGHRLAGCLEYAHSRRDASGRALNIVHRDVSPPNVLIGIHGEIKLTDFGVARAEIRNIHTRPGVLRGKYAYMSPEQVRHEPVDHRSDIFSLGTVLYEALTGVNPFEGSTDYQTMESVGQADVEPAGFMRPDTPAELDRILVTCLEPEPEDRYANAGELRRDLGQLMLQFRKADEPQALVDFLRDVFPERAAVPVRAMGVQGKVPLWEGLAHRLSPMEVPIPARLPGSTQGALRLAPRSLLDESGADYSEAARPDQPTWPGKARPAEVGAETAEMGPEEVLRVFSDAGLDQTDPERAPVGRESGEAELPEGTDPVVTARDWVTDPGVVAPTDLDLSARPPVSVRPLGPHGTQPGSEKPAPSMPPRRAPKTGTAPGQRPSKPRDTRPAVAAPSAPAKPASKPPERRPPPPAIRPASAPLPAPIQPEAAPDPTLTDTDRRRSATPSSRRTSPVFREVGLRGRKDPGLPGFVGVPSTRPGAGREPLASRERPAPGFLPPENADAERSSPGLPVPILGQEEPEAPIQPEPIVPPPMGSLMVSDPLLRGLRRPPPETDMGVPFVNEWALGEADFHKTEPAAQAFRPSAPPADLPVEGNDPTLYNPIDTDEAIDSIWDGGPDPNETLDESMDEGPPGPADDSADSWDINTPEDESDSAWNDVPAGGTVPSGEAFEFGSSFAPSDLQVLGGQSALDDFRGTTKASAPNFAEAAQALADEQAEVEEEAPPEEEWAEAPEESGRSWSPWLLLLLLVPALGIWMALDREPTSPPTLVEDTTVQAPTRRVEPLEPVGARPAAQPPPARKRDDR